MLAKGRGEYNDWPVLCFGSPASGIYRLIANEG
jgi:hypothetical protein